MLYLYNNPGRIFGTELTSGELTFVQNLSGISYSTGDMLYHNGTSLVRFPIGSTGQVIKVSAGVPIWADESGGGGSSIWGGIIGTLSDQTDLQLILDEKVNLTGSQEISDKTLTNTDKIAFDITSTTDAELGEIKWDEDNETLVMGIDTTSVPINIHSDLFINQTGSTIVKGTPLAFSGSVGASGKITAEPFINDGTMAGDLFLGFTYTDVADGDSGVYITNARIRGLDTDAYVDGTLLYLSTTVAGQLQDTEPSSPVPIKNPVAAVVHSHGVNGILQVRLHNGQSLFSDGLVQRPVSPPADKMLMVWNSSNESFDIDYTSYSSITDFDSGVEANSQVQDNTAARHIHANIVILDDITAAFTSTLETKLNGIESGAEVNDVDSVNGQTGVVVLSANEIDSVYTPTSYTETTPDIDGHLEGIDNALGAISGSTNLSYTSSPTDGTVTSDTGTDATLPLADGVNAGLFSPSEKSKLSGIATGATANSSDAILLNRANHTGTQTASTISDFTETSQDAIGGALLDSTSIDLIYDDTANTISAQREALTGAITAPKNSNATSLGSFTLSELNTALSDADVATGGGTATGTNTGDQTSIVGITGTKAQFNTAIIDGDILFVGDITQYTDEQAQDAVGNILVDTSEINFTYNDATPSITGTVNIINALKIESDFFGTSVEGALTQLDADKQNTLISGTNIKTVNGNSLLGPGNIVISGSGLSLVTVEVNLGTVPRRSGNFTITTTGLNVGRPVLVTQAFGPYTGKGTLDDEGSGEIITVKAKTISTTEIKCYYESVYMIMGNYKFDYVVG